MTTLTPNSYAAISHNTNKKCHSELALKFIANEFFGDSLLEPLKYEILKTWTLDKKVTVCIKMW